MALCGLEASCEQSDSSRRADRVPSAMSALPDKAAKGAVKHGRPPCPKGAKPRITARVTRNGQKAIRVEYPDGRVVDISATRVKEFVPNTHPKAPPGTQQKVKFDTPYPDRKVLSDLLRRKSLNYWRNTNE